MAIVDEAGAVPVRRVGREWHVMLVTAKSDPEVWIFPKGHIEAGESPTEAALREAREEAGISGRIIGPAGSIEFRAAHETIRVAYFLVETSDTGSPESGRRAAWLPFEEAVARLTHEDARSLLRNSRSLLDQAQSFPPFSPDPTSERK